MEKVADGAGARSLTKFPLSRTAALVLGCCVACGGALAQDSLQQAQDTALAEARPELPVRLEVNASALPRLESQDTGFQAPRVDVSLLSPGRSGLGIAIGMSSTGSRSGFQPVGIAPRTAVHFGFRWRPMVQSQQFDVTAWCRMNTDQEAY